MRNNAAFWALAEDYFSLVKASDLHNFDDFEDEKEARDTFAEYLFYQTEDVLAHLHAIAKDKRLTIRANTLIQEIRNELASV